MRLIKMYRQAKEGNTFRDGMSPMLVLVRADAGEDKDWSCPVARFRGLEPDRAGQRTTFKVISRIHHPVGKSTVYEYEYMKYLALGKRCHD